MQDTLSRLYGVFQKTLETHPDVASPDKSAMMNSIYFCNMASGEEVDALLRDADRDTLITSIKRGVQACQFPTHERAFIGAVYTICASRLLERKESAFALRLAEEAIDYNWLDLFPQDIILQANHQMDPRLPSLEDTKAWLKTRFCMYPFNWFETGDKEDVYSCCPTFLPTSIGTLSDIARDGLDAVRNSPAAKKIQESILDGSFRYCSKMHCTSINNKWLMSREEGLERVKTVGAWPEEIMFSHDRSCNLSCPSCRKERIVIPKSEQDRFDALSETLLVPLIQHAINVRITGSGDPFGSIHFRNLLRDFCRDTPVKVRKLILQTNAVLCDKKAWDEIGLYGHVKEIYVSIDAATEATYNIVRRGGNFKRLMENMRFLSDLREQGEFYHFQQRFVVQALNFREMPDFIRMGMDFGCDAVEFNTIRNWGHYSAQEFAQQNIVSVDHPDHQEFLEMLKDPIFDNKGVHLSGLSNLRPAKKEQEQPILNAPQAPSLNLVVRLYIEFLRTVVKYPEIVSSQPPSMTDSTLFYQATNGLIDSLVQMGDCKTIINFVKQAIEGSGINQHTRLFIGAACTACAVRALECRLPHMAQELAEESLVHNPLDQLSKNIIAKAKGSLDRKVC